MKTSRVLLAVVLLLAFAMPATAAKKKAADTNTDKVSVTGDLVRDGRVVIDVDWTVDTAKYPGLSRDELRKKVRSEIWDKVLTKVIDATKGQDISYDRSNFTTIKEYHDLIQTRPDGSKLYSLKIQSEFTAQPAPAAAPIAKEQPAPKKQDKGFVLQQRWDNDM